MKWYYGITIFVIAVGLLFLFALVARAGAACG